MGIIMLISNALKFSPFVFAQRLDKSSGFVEENNSGRSNIFSTGDKALYSYSPTTDKIVKQGLGGLQGLLIVLTIAGLVTVTTISISMKTANQAASSVDFTDLDGLLEIASRLQ